MNPDCRDGKHDACNGDGWDTWADEPVACPCDCHTPATAPEPTETNRTPS